MGPVPVCGLFETHLTVSDLQRSITFYKDVIGLELGLEVPERNCAFFWIGESKHSMLGLWSIGTMPLGLVLHLAFEVTLDDLLSATRRLRSNGVTPLSFFEGIKEGIHQYHKSRHLGNCLQYSIKLDL